jgi:uncharacterized membrane-anchored protein
VKIVRLVVFIAVALVQLSLPASVVLRREQTLRHGRVWKFKTAPVDPTDAVRGRYIALRFAAEAKLENHPVPSGSTVYLVLAPDPGGFAKVDKVSATPRRGDNVIRVRSGARVYNRVSFPFDRLWVAEQDAAAAEQAYVENSRRGNESAYVTVRVRDGDAAVEKLYINNQPLDDYLRAQSRKKGAP